MRFHSSREPWSADHSESTLKNVGVARLEFSAPYLTVKSFVRIAASIVPFAAATSARSENATVRPLSARTASRRRAATADATAPYDAEPSARMSANIPRRLSPTGSASEVRRRRRLPRRGRSVAVGVLHQHRVGVEYP